jgi:glycosyltransferase involved in cell wall biosynthesis
MQLPNFVAGFAEHTSAEAGQHALIAGRLVEEKGFDTAIAAAAAAGVPLVVAGEGPDEPRLRKLANGANVRFTGRLTQDDLARARADAAVALVPSRWEEHCPYAVLDAMAAGVPTLVSDLGGLPELVDAEDVVAPGRWSEALAALWRDPNLRHARGERALARARARHNGDTYYEALMRIYG